MIVSSVSTKGQLVIPYELRQKYGIKPNTLMRWIDTGQGLMLVPLTDDPISSSKGMLKDANVSTKSYLKAKEEDKRLEDI
jgi:bifunctional DNA-binding transcriptional regulator/antitoxin component of YhaV-PrlF toxin-antitoxin module